MNRRELLKIGACAPAIMWAGSTTDGRDEPTKDTTCANIPKVEDPFWLTNHPVLAYVVPAIFSNDIVLIMGNKTTGQHDQWAFTQNEAREIARRLLYWADQT